MGKRSSFERRKHDAYDTPFQAVLPLSQHLPPCRFIEPCAGNGALVEALEIMGFECVHRSDITTGTDAMSLTNFDMPCAPIITNPPWTRSVLHPMIRHFAELRSTWLLFDADWPHTKQSAELMGQCHEIIPVGRLKWIPDSPHTGKDNCAWYRFENSSGPCRFHARESLKAKMNGTVEKRS